MERKLLRKEGFKAKKLWRAALFASTGLSAVLSLPAMVRAQTTIPADTTPQGGVVVGGAASITQAPASTTINQGSERAAINWQSFDVGSGAKVQFNQPDASAIALNRVVGGNLSQINGQINANGQIVLINQSGVVFGRGAQVNAENIVVSTSDIATKDFMAGNMAFTGAPNPGAKIINEGNITVKDTGLVGLIAPQVENDGVIVARLGQVVLAGASAFTLDLYGDRLISLDVTKAVQAVDVNGAKVPALVTNRGVILADGGKVTLTAQDADALVTQLINAGGTIRADSVGSQAGTISIQGVGGNISIAGNLLARGAGAKSSGGAIEAVTSGTVSVAPTADIDVSGNAGGGVIAIGTDIARARQGAADVSAPKAAAVTIAQGATLNADATGLGNAGTVTLLSSQNTAFDGAISVQGGSLGGNGGVAEISSDGVISLGGTVLATAINGKAGEILLDPQTLVVTSASSTNTGSVVSGSITTYGNDGTATVTSYIKNSDLDALSGTIILEAASLISVTASVNSTSIQELSLVSAGSISVAASIDITGSIDLDAGGSLFVGAGLTGASVLLTSGTAGTEIDAGVTAAGAVTLGSAGTIFEDAASGSIITANLLSAGSIGGDVSLSGGNTITTLAGFTLGGNLTLANSGGLTVGGSVSAHNISLSGASLTFESGVHTGLLQLASSGTISQGAGTITANTLTGNGTILVSLGDANTIGTLAGFAVTGGTFGLVDTGSLAITGSVSGTDVFISVPTLSLAANVSATAASAPTLGLAIDTLSVASGSFAAAGGTIAIAPHNSTFGIDLAGSAPSNLDIAASLVSAFSAPEILIGHAFGSSASSISIDGPINFGATEVDLPTPGKILDNSGTFTAGTLLFDAAGFTQNPTAAIDTTLFSGDGGAVSGNVQLAGASNAIGTLAGFTDNGTFSLVDAGSLNVTGTMAGADVYLAVPTLALAAGAAIHATTTAPTLALASDDITLAGSNSFAASGGTISIAPLTASTVIDFGSASSPGTLGLPGSLVSALDSTASKIIIGNGPIGTQASGIDIDGSVSFGSTPVIDLSTSGTIFDNAGSLTAGTVEFGAPGGFTQTSTAGITATQFGGDGGTSGSALLVGENTISSFTSLPLSASSTLAVFDSGTLTIAGAIDPEAVTLYGTAGLDIGTNVSATLLEIGSGGTIIQTGGSITATTLASFGSIGGYASLVSTTNSIGTLGAFTLGGTLDLADAGSLAVAGTVDGPFITLSAGGIGFTGAVSASNVLALQSTGPVTQTGGSITAGTLSSIGTVNGNALFASTTNSIGTLGSFLAADTLTVFDSIALATAGTIAAPVVSLSAAGISFKGADVNAPTELALGGTGNIEQVVVGSPIVSISTGSLISIGTIGGDVLLGFGSGTSTIDVIGDFSLTGNFELANQTRANLTGVISTPDGTFGLVGGGLTETGAGAIDASQFNNVDDNAGGAYLGISGNLLLTGSNTISSLDTNTGASNAISTTGTFALNDTVPLTVGKEVLGADVTIAAPTLSLESGATIAANTSTPTLALASDDITLGGANTFLAGSGTIAIAPFSGGTTIGIGDASSTGTLGLPGSLVSALDTTASEIIIGNGPVGHQASAIDIDNSTSFGGTTVVDLSTSGSISQSGARSYFNAAKLEFDAAGFTQKASDTIVAATLQGDGGTIGGSVLLPGSANVIGTLTAISLATGTLSLNDNHSLTVAGTVAAPSVSLSTIIGPINITGFVDAPTELALSNSGASSGAITEPGSITTGTLTSDLSGSATLTGTNTITTLGGFLLTGDLALSDSRALDIAGAVTTAGNITLTGTSLTESTGSVTASTLTTGSGSFSNSVSLSGTANSIASLGAFTVASGTLTLDDTGTLTVADTISAPTTTLSATGSIDLESSIIAPTQLALGSGGSITQGAGTIYTGNFISDGSIGGDVSLTSANSITALGDFTLGGTLRLYDASSLDVTGLVQAASSGGAIVLESGSTIFAPGTLLAATVSLSAASLIDLSGTINAPTLLALAGGFVTQTSGALIAGSLSSGGNTSTRSVSLSGTANTIAALGSFFTDGSFDLVDTGSLNINGSVSGQNISLSVPTLGLDASVDSTLSGGTLALAADQFTITAGTLGANAGTIELAPYTGGYGIDLGGSAANALDLTGNISTLFGGSPVAYIIGAALGSKASFIDVDGSVSFATGTVDLTTAGTILDNTGTLSAPTLEFDAASFTQSTTAAIAATLLQGDGGTIAGSVLLAGTANSIGTLGALSLASGTLALTDAGTLNVTGAVTAPDIYLTDSNANGINLGGGSLIAGSSGTIGLTSDALAETGGTISAPGGLVRIAPYTPANDIDFGGTGLGGLGLKTGFIDIIGGQVLQIGTGGGSITQENNFTIAPQTLVLDGTSINFTGSLGVPTLLSFTSAGDVSENAAATISVPTLSGTASGTISLIGTNAIGTLDALSAGANITINNAPSLLIAGLVSAGTGTLNSITLDDNAGITEVAGGTLTAGTLTTGAGSIGGSAFLTNGNSIGLLSGFTVADDLRFTDAASNGALTLGSLNAGATSFSADGIVIAGQLDIGAGNGTLALFSTGGISESAAGVVDAGTFTGTDSGGDVALLQGNSISTLGGFAVSGHNFSLQNSIGLDIAGLVTAGTIVLAGTSLTESTGTLSAAALSTGAGDFTANVSLTGENTVNTLAGFTLSAGTLTLDDTGLLTVDGPVNAPITTLSAQTMAIAGTISASTGLALEGGHIYETVAGFVATPSLTSGGATITGNVSLANSNSISTLGSFTTNGDLTLDDGGALTIAGPARAGNASVSAAGITITGGIGAGMLNLASSAGIAEQGGVINAATLTGSSADSATFLGANTIATLGGFSVSSGDFGISNANVLEIAGLVTATGTITLEGVGDTEVAGGRLTAAMLESGGTAITGNVALGNANEIGTLGGFTVSAGDTLALTDTGLLTIAGPVMAPFATIAADSIAVAGTLEGGVATLSAGSIDIGGTISLAAVLALESTGNITESTGFVTVPTLTSGGTSIAGDVTLGDVNSIGTLGGFTTASDLVLNDGTLLTVSGPVNAADATLTADGVAISGAITTSGTLALYSASDVTETGGGVNAALLTGTVSSGGATLQGTNTIATLGAFTVSSGTLALDDTGLLTVAGPVVAPTATLAADTIAVTGAMSGATTTLTGGSITISGLISAMAALALESTGNITEVSGGIIATPSLTSGGTTIGGDVALSGTGNVINTLGGFTLGAGGTLALDDTGLLTVAGPVVTPFATISADTLAVSGVFSGTTATFAAGGGGIGVIGSISLATLLALASGGNVTESGSGAISTATLVSVGTISGDVALANRLNAIGTLGNFSIGAGDTLDLAGSGLLTVSGQVSAPFATIAADSIDVTGTLSGSSATLLAGAGGIGITGLINSGSLLALASSGNITESGAGGIATATLISLGSIGGNVLLTDTLDNAIGTLGGFTIGAGDTLVLAESGLLAVAGPVAAVNATFYAGTLAIAGSLTGANQTLSGGDVIIEAPVSVASLLALESSGYVTETGAGVVTAPTLTTGGGTVAGDVSLGNTANDIGALGGFTIGGTLDLADLGSPGLIIGGPVVAPYATLLANTIAGAGDFSGTTATFSAGSIDVGGLVSLSTLLALESSGDISESTGTIDTATLTSGGTMIGGNVALTDTANSIGTLGGFTLAPGGSLALDLADSGLLTVAGAVAAPDATFAAGSLAISGSVGIAQTLALETNGGGVAESGGQITAGTLTSDGTTIQGTVALTNANTVATLSSFAATGFIVLDNSPSLTIDGLVSTPGALTLAQSGDITEVAGGTLAVGILSSGTVATGNVALGNANEIGTLGGFTVSAGDTLALTDTGLLTIAGPVMAPFAMIAADSIAVAGTLEGGVATLSAGSIDIGGTISLAAVLALESSGYVTETGAGVVTAPTLTTGGGTVAGDVSLGNTANDIGALGGFTIGGTLDLADLGSPGLIIGGPVVAPYATLLANTIAGAGEFSGTTATFSAGSIDVGGLVSLSTLLALESTGDISESAGTIDTATLTSGGTTIGGDVALTDTANSIGTLCGFTLGAGGTLALDDTGLLTVAGPVVTPFATISADTLAVSGVFSGTTATFAAGGGGIGVIGSISLATLLALASGGNVTESGSGAISTATLVSVGTISGDVALANRLNAIGTLGNFSIGAGDTLDLAGSGLLTVSGQVSAPFATIAADSIDVTGTLSGSSATLLAGAGGIGITGLINSGSLLALASSGNITESGAGGIATATLISLGSIGGNVLLTDTLDNAIGTLGGFTIGAGDTLVLAESGLLAVAGPVAAVNATFYAGTLAIAGSLTGANQTLSGGDVIIEAPVSVASLLALESSGYVTETGAGVVTAPTLTTGGGTVAGDVSLGNTANDIGALGGFTIGGTLDLADLGSPGLIIGGPVVAPYATLLANTIAGAGDFSGTTATFSAGSIDVGGLVSLSTLLALESSGDISESTGTIDTATLTSGGTMIGGNVALTDTANSIGTLGGFTLAPGGSLALDLADSGLLTVAGAVAAPDATFAAGSLAISGSVGIAQTLALETNGGGVAESGGQITAGTLTSDGTTIQGTVALTNANTIATLSSFAATGFIVLDNSPSLTIDGLVSTPGALTLAQSGDITEVAGGTLAVGMLSSGTVATGNVLLGNANGIGTLGGFTVAAGDTLALTDAGLLTIAGPVIAPFATIGADSIAVAGTLDGGVATLSAGSIDIGGTISLATVLALESTGNVTESTGFVTAPTLTSGGTTITGGVTLGDVNGIGTLGGFTTASDLVLNDGTLLTVSGPVNAADATLTADGVAISGAITTSGTLALYSASDVTETGGGVNAALLTGTVSSGNATLQGTNTIATLGAFMVSSGTLALDDTGLLTVAGPVVAPTATLSADTIAVTGTMSGATTTLTGGSISISGLISAMAALALESTGNITEVSGGIIATPSLTSGGTTIGGDVALSGTGNVINTLGGFTLGAGRTLALDDTGLLTVAGAVAAPFATLFSGTIVITGSLDAPEALALESTGNMTEPGGFITTTSLTSGGTSIGGNVALTGMNVINTLAAFSDAGAFTLDDTGLLTVAGPVVAAVGTVSAPTIAINGAIDASERLALESSGDITEGGTGAVTTGTLTSGGGAIGGDVTLNSAHNSITALGQFAAAGLALDDQTPLAVSAPVAVTGVLALLDAGNVTQTGGTISAGTLTSDGGTIGGAAAFNQPGNDIPVLGAFGALAGLALTDAAPLNLAGNIFTGSTAPLTLTDTGGAMTQSGGTISSGTLNVNGSNVTLGQANAIGSAGSITAANAYVNGVGGISGPVNVSTGTFLSAGALPVTGNISASSNLVLQALGGIAQSAGNITAGAATLIAGGDIVLSGVLAAAGDLDLTAGGNISHPAGLLTAGTLSGAVGGTVITALGTVDGNGSLASFNASSLTTDFGTIGNFIMQDSTFALINDGPLVLLGSLVANTVSITTNGPLTFEGTANGAGGGLFIDANPVSATPYFTPQPGDSVITVTNGGITQTGVFNINAGNAQAADLPGNLFIFVTGGGSVAFAMQPGELYAPTVNLEISDGSGAVSGNVILQRLVILNALTQSVQLTGQLDGLGGQAAASKGFVDPFPEPGFRFNACPVGSVNCTILPIETLPPVNPIDNFDLSNQKRKKLNNNVHLPGVATRDF